MARNEIVDPGPILREMLKERMRSVESQYPEPRSRTDRKRIETERRRLIRELRVLRGTTKWAVPPEKS